MCTPAPRHACNVCIYATSAHMHLGRVYVCVQACSIIMHVHVHVLFRCMHTHACRHVCRFVSRCVGPFVQNCVGLFVSPPVCGLVCSDPLARSWSGASTRVIFPIGLRLPLPPPRRHFRVVVQGSPGQGRISTAITHRQSVRLTATISVKPTSTEIT